MYHDGETEIRRETFRDRAPCMTVVVAAQHADVRPWSAWSRPLRPSTMILHVETARGRVVPRDFVHALTEFRIRIRIESGTNASVRRIERLAAVLTQIMSPRRDAEMHALAVADD